MVPEFEENGRDLIEVTSRHLSGRSEENYETPQNTGNQAEIRTLYLLNANRDRYRLVPLYLFIILQKQISSFKA
jgi:hypothetical protein